MNKAFPRPWHVAYRPYFSNWDPKSLPTIMDASGGIVLKMPQSADVDHPGVYDAEADALAHLIVNSVNMEASNDY